MVGHRFRAGVSTKCVAEHEPNLSDKIPSWLIAILTEQDQQSKLEVGVCPANVGNLSDFAEHRSSYWGARSSTHQGLYQDKSTKWLGDAKSNHFSTKTPSGTVTSATSEFHSALAFPMALLVTQYYFYLYFDFVLCKIDPLYLRSHA